MAKIFISYRRSDSADASGRLYDRLEKQFGRQAIFMDVDSIPVGVNFRSHLKQSVVRCNVLLAVIGENWLDVSYEEGPRQRQRRLDDPDDFVRIEIETAFASGIPVVPVLVGAATMPTQGELPPGMKELADQQAAEARSGKDFHVYVDRLIRILTPMLGMSLEQGASDTTRSAIGYSEATESVADAVTVNSASPAPEVATRINDALRDIDADEHRDMGSIYILDKNSRRIFGRVKAELAFASSADILHALLPHLDSTHPMVRWKAMRLLLWWKLATTAIIRRFWEKEPKWVCRQLVIEAAQTLEERDRFNLLADVALLDDNASNRAAALPSLSVLAQGPQRGRVIDVLLELLDVRDPWGAFGARPEALRQLRGLKVADAVEKACQILREDGDHFTRTEAASLITELGPVASLLDIGEAFADERMNDHMFKTCVTGYLKRFNQTAVAAVVDAMGSAKSRELAEAVVRESNSPPLMSPYYGRLSGKLVFKDASEQTFSGFRCFYSNRLYYSQNVESLGKTNYTTAASIEVKQILRIDFSERPNDNLRQGVAQLRNGKILQDMFFYVGECSWWEEPGLEGKLADPSISALVIAE